MCVASLLLSLPHPLAPSGVSSPMLIFNTGILHPTLNFILSSELPTLA